MPLPTLFNAQTISTGQQLDDNFSALGFLTVISCSIAGTNALALTPFPNTPTVSAYGNHMMFGGVAGGTNTGATTATVAGLGTLSVFKGSAAGPVALAAGNIFVGNFIILVYNSALSGGSGGFQLVSVY
jgi:hypothetical protein